MCANVGPKYEVLYLRIVFDHALDVTSACPEQERLGLIS